MVTRVDKFLGGLGVNLTDKLDVQANATVTIGDGTSTGNLYVGGNAIVNGIDLTANVINLESNTAEIASNVAKTDLNQTFVAAQRAEVSILSDVSSNVTLDFNDSNHWEITLANSITLLNPSNLVAGQSGSIVVKQNNVGSQTLSFESSWKFPEGTAPTLSTTANAVDRIDYFVNSNVFIHAVEALNVS